MTPDEAALPVTTLPAKHAPRGPLKARDPMGGADPMTGRCSAKSKQTKAPCRQPAIPGGTVCRYHGGAAPQVRLAALERLKAYQDRAIDRLFKLVEQEGFPSTSLSAVKDVLDRTMGRPAETVQVTGAEGGPLVVRWER